MRIGWTHRLTVAVGIALLSAGCQRSLFVPLPSDGSVVSAAFEETRSALAADVPETAPGVKPVAAPPPASQPARVRPYTVPGSRIQQLAFLGMLAAGPAPGITSSGKEAAESSISLAGTGAAGGTIGGTGIAGLGAPQPRTLTAVVGQPGLQRGFAAGLGFVRPDNLFMPRPNPLTGPTGRCWDLTRAGFFPNVTACQQHFAR